jgi:DNA repair protein REV1
MDDGGDGGSGNGAAAVDAAAAADDPAYAPTTTTNNNNSNNKREREPTLHWADTGFAGYIQAKIRKLEEQHRSNQAQQPAASAVFRGVAIHVNGLTNPSHAELKQLMALHGGGFDTYYSRSTTTHVVCSALPDAKLRQLVGVKSSAAPPIVRPEWVVACVRAGALLPTRAFEILPGAAGPQQPRLAFPTAAAAAGGGGGGGGGGGPAARPAAPFAPLRPEEIYPPSAAEALAAATTPGTAAAPSPAPLHNNNAAEAAADPDEASADLAADPAADARAQALAARLRRECDLLRGPPRTTADDPNFVATYFRASRLHFIGSWKARIEALMASSSAAPFAAAAAADTGPPRAAPPHPKHQQQQQQQQQHPPERVILHVDLDAFFATASSLGRPEFAGRPLAVGHSAAEQGSGEISSANYEARARGVSAGMAVRDALRLCPGLVVVPYEFERYEDLSERFYRCLLRRSAVVEPLSVDEAFVDVTALAAAERRRRRRSKGRRSGEEEGGGGGGEDNGDPDADPDADPDGVDALAAELRADIERATGGCTASVGIGPNKLLARLATRAAKPRGQRRLGPGAEALPFLASLPASSLPGVGWSLTRRLADMGVETVAQLRSTSRAQLATKLGKATGEQLWRHSHGLDDRPVQPPAARRSVGAEVNWGVRLSTDEQARQLTADICREVAARAAALGGGGGGGTGGGGGGDAGAAAATPPAAAAAATAPPAGGVGGVRARCVTLKVKRRAAAAEDLPPHKFLGHGLCDNLSRSVTLARAVWREDDIAREALGLLQALQVPPRDIRGVGVALSKLEPRAGGGSGGGGGGGVAGTLGGAAAMLAREQQRQDQAAAAGVVAGQEREEQTPPRPPSARRPETAAAATTPAAKRSLFRSPPPPPAPSPARGGQQQQQLAGGLMGPPRPRLPAVATTTTTNTNTIVPLPPASQLDPEVLAALPLAVRRELEAQYRRPLLPGVGAIAAAGRAAAAARGGGSGGKRPAAPPTAAAAAAPPAPRLPPSARMPSLSQIDPDTFAELPESVQRELLDELQPRKGGRLGVGGGGSGGGGGAAARAAAAGSGGAASRAASAAAAASALLLQRRAEERAGARRAALEPPPLGLRVAPLVLVAGGSAQERKTAAAAAAAADAPPPAHAAAGRGRLAFAAEPWPAVRSALSGALDAALRDGDDYDEHRADAPANTDRLGVLSEWLAHWLLACVHGGGAASAAGAAAAAAPAPPDLEAAAACLRFLRRRAAAGAALRPHAQALEELVRREVLGTYGFELCV